jgi:hypothetical protein
MSTSEKRLRYGSQKYAALNLMAARWLRFLPPNSVCFEYVTLGGTELLDVLIFHWIDGQILSHTLSFEMRSDRYALAKKTGEHMRQKGIEVDILEGDIFEYERRGNQSHIFFIDLEGICKPRPFIKNFQGWLESGILELGDFLLITSYLGRNPGWAKTLDCFDAEFRLLRVSDLNEKKVKYQDTHPLFVLYRALLEAGLDKEIQLNCLGCVKYRDTSPMGLYGITLSEGQTRLATLTRNFPVFDMNKKDWDHVVFAESTEESSRISVRIF